VWADIVGASTVTGFLPLHMMEEDRTTDQPEIRKTCWSELPSKGPRPKATD
jgi:hypothetical protein